MNTDESRRGRDLTVEEIDREIEEQTRKMRDRAAYFSPEDERVGSYEEFQEERERAKKRKKARERTRWGLHYARRHPCSHPALVK